MRVVITGGGGQVARSLMSTASRHLEVTALGRTELDITDPEAVEAAISTHRPDLVVNAAAYTAVDMAERERELARSINCDGAAILAAASIRARARLVHLSTDFVFDGLASSPYTPATPICPIGIYGESKAAGEAAVLANAPNALIVRTAWVYAAAGNNFLTTMLRLMRGRAEIRVVADQIGTPTHALSLARSLWALTALNAQGIHHFTDAGVASWYDFAVAILEEGQNLGLLDEGVSLVPIRTEDYPTPARRPAYSVLDKTTTYAAIGGARHWRTELRAALQDIRNG